MFQFINIKVLKLNIKKMKKPENSLFKAITSTNKKDRITKMN